MENMCSHHEVNVAVGMLAADNSCRFKVGLKRRCAHLNDDGILFTGQAHCNLYQRLNPYIEQLQPKSYVSVPCGCGAYQIVTRVMRVFTARDCYFSVQ